MIWMPACGQYGVDVWGNGTPKHTLYLGRRNEVE